MKATELIKNLQEIVDTHGDKTVLYCYTDDSGYGLSDFILKTSEVVFDEDDDIIYLY